MRNTITDNGVSSGARHLFHILKDFARGKNWPECWPGKWRLAEETGRSVRMVQYYLRELVKSGAVEIIGGSGIRNRYRILLGVNGKILSQCTDAPLQYIAEVGLQPIAEVGLQPIAEVGDSSINREAIIQQAAQITEVLAAAAEEKSFEEEMQNVKKNCFDELIKLGMPHTTEVWNIIHNDHDLASQVLRHCKKRFSGRGKPVNSRAGYIVACLRNPAKFGFSKVEGRTVNPDGEVLSQSEARSKAEATRKAANENRLATDKEDAEKRYAFMKDLWEKLPEVARQEVRDVVAKESPLFHESGADTQEFELQCMREAIAFKRESWRRKHLG